LGATTPVLRTTPPREGNLWGEGNCALTLALSQRERGIFGGEGNCALTLALSQRERGIVGEGGIVGERELLGRGKYFYA